MGSEIFSTVCFPTLWEPPGRRLWPQPAVLPVRNQPRQPVLHGPLHGECLRVRQPGRRQLRLQPWHCQATKTGKVCCVFCVVFGLIRIWNTLVLKICSLLSKNQIKRRKLDKSFCIRERLGAKCGVFPHLISIPKRNRHKNTKINRTPKSKTHKKERNPGWVPPLHHFHPPISHQAHEQL